MTLWLVLVCAWSAVVARLARRRGWDPKTCSLTALLPLGAVAFLGLIFSHRLDFPAWVNFFVYGGIWAAIISRRLAYRPSELSKANNDLTILNLHS